MTDYNNQNNLRESFEASSTISNGVTLLASHSETDQGQSLGMCSRNIKNAACSPPHSKSQPRLSNYQRPSVEAYDSDITDNNRSKPWQGSKSFWLPPPSTASDEYYTHEDEGQHKSTSGNGKGCSSGDKGNTKPSLACQKGSLRSEKTKDELNSSYIKEVLSSKGTFRHLLESQILHQYKYYKALVKDPTPWVIPASDIVVAQLSTNKDGDLYKWVESLPDKSEEEVARGILIRVKLSPGDRKTLLHVIHEEGLWSKWINKAEIEKSAYDGSPIDIYDGTYTT